MLRLSCQVGRFICGLVTIFWTVSAGQAIGEALTTPSFSLWTWTGLAAVVPLIPFAGYKYLTAKVSQLDAAQRSAGAAEQADGPLIQAAPPPKQ